MDPTIQRAFDAAKLAEANNRIEDAAQIYDYVVQTFPESGDAHHARQELMRLRGNHGFPIPADPAAQSNGQQHTHHSNGYIQNPAPTMGAPHQAPQVTNGQPQQALPPPDAQPSPEEVADAVEHARYKARVFPAKKKYKSGYAISRVVLVFGIVSVLLSVGLGLMLSQLTRTDGDVMIGIASVAGLFFGGTVMILFGLVARALFDTANVNRRVAELLDVHTAE